MGHSWLLNWLQYNAVTFAFIKVLKYIFLRQIKKVKYSQIIYEINKPKDL